VPTPRSRARQRPGTPLGDLTDAWSLALRAERKSPATIKSYHDAVAGYLTWCAETGTDAATTTTLNRAAAGAFLVSLLDAGAAPATARSRYTGLRRFGAWLLDEGETDADPLGGMKPPKLDTAVIDPLSEDELRALVAACADKRFGEFCALRDVALVRLMAETGIRAGETADLAAADVKWREGTALVRRGKGGKGRVVPFGTTTATALERYERRARREHRLAADPEASYFLGDRGKAFGYDALHRALAKRAALAGLEGFHPHRLRHTAAHRWLAAGGSESGLMAVAGWSRPDMLARYTAAKASERAADEARGLNLGDW
jgi:integrase/recombinase XerD